MEREPDRSTVLAYQPPRADMDEADIGGLFGLLVASIGVGVLVFGWCVGAVKWAQWRTGATLLDSRVVGTSLYEWLCLTGPIWTLTALFAGAVVVVVVKVTGGTWPRQALLLGILGLAGVWIVSAGACVMYLDGPFP